MGKSDELKNVIKRIKFLCKEMKSRKLNDDEAKELAELRNKEKELRGNGRDDKFVPGNDFSWWNKVPELLKNAVNVVSNWIAGTPLDPVGIPFTPEGAATIHYTPSYGKNADATDPINVWARDLYLRMFQKYRGISSYSSSDLGIAIIAALEVVRMVSHLERVYGVINRYNRLNVNMPETEIAALGLTQVEADAIRDHLSDFRYDLNVLIRKMQRLCIPKDISLIQNIISLNGFEYLDHENSKAQIIVFLSDCYGVYVETSLTTGGCIYYEDASDQSYISMGGTGSSFPFLSYMLDQLLGSDSIQRIFADLLVWFGEDAMLQFEPIDESYVVLPVYSESILHKIHNMEACQGNLMMSTLLPVIHKDMDAADIAELQTAPSHPVIYQYMDKIVTKIQMGQVNLAATNWKTEGNWLYQSFSFAPNTIAVRQSSNPGLLDTYRKEVTPEIVTEGSLFKCDITPITVAGSPNVYCYPLENYCFEIVTGISTYYLSNGTAVTTVSNLSNLQSYTTSITEILAGQLAILDWAPLTYAVNNGKYVRVRGDIDTPIPLYAGTLHRIGTAIQYSGLQTDVKVVAH